MDISVFLNDTPGVRYNTVYEDSLFSRKSASLDLSSDVKIAVTKDCHIKEKVFLYSFLLSLRGEGNQSLSFEIGRDLYSIESVEFSLLSRNHHLICIPTPPVQRDYNQNGNVYRDSEQELKYRYIDADDNVTMTVDCCGNKTVEFNAVKFQEDIERYISELTCWEPEETRRIKGYAFFDYCSIKQAWDYVVQGNIFHVDYCKNQPLRWPCQQCANMLYGYLRYLHSVTNKQIYFILCKQIAYSVMLGLPEDGRWKQGVWSDEMETHTRHQIEGVDLMVSAYQDFSQDIFLNKASLAMDYLVSIAEPLNVGTWFLHDTVEANQDLNILRKKFSGFFISSAFGKSTGNTLCLNTHVWTLAVLRRLNLFLNRPDYDEHFSQGIIALQYVLMQKPANTIYWLVFKVRDFLYALTVSRGRGFVKKITTKYKMFLKQYLLPALKKRFPRLRMPGGFLERDLSATHLTTYYYLVNIQDLLGLYSQHSSEWLKQIIESSVLYAHKSKWVKYVSIHEHRTAIYVNILLLCVLYFQKQQYLDLLIEYLRLLEDRNYTLSADLFGHWAIGRPVFRVAMKSKHPYYFSLRANGVDYGIIMNSSSYPAEYILDTHGCEKVICNIRFQKGILSCIDQAYKIDAGGYMFFEITDSIKKQI